MIPQKQTRVHPNGDCVRACIATLLELPITTVPDWTAMPDNTKEDELPVFWAQMQIWLAGRGYQFLEIQLEHKTWMPLCRDTYAIFIGRHKVGGARHAVVGRCFGDRFALVFDPLSGDTTGEVFKDNKIEAVCFLVPTDPYKLRLRLRPCQLPDPTSSAPVANGAATSNS